MIVGVVVRDFTAYLIEEDKETVVESKILEHCLALSLYTEDGQYIGVLGSSSGEFSFYAKGRIVKVERDIDSPQNLNVYVKTV